ncbi:MAG: hypothetical protein LBN30_07580 [Oscillospiraceae bacterium]|jgi:hypothetical protein|nr:hypothetical protein [Oscillospiraceae bacterium]
MSVTFGVWQVAVGNDPAHFAEIHYNLSSDTVPGYSSEKDYYIVVETVGGLVHKVNIGRSHRGVLGEYQDATRIYALEHGAEVLPPKDEPVKKINLREWFDNRSRNILERLSFYEGFDPTLSSFIGVNETILGSTVAEWSLGRFVDAPEATVVITDQTTGATLTQDATGKLVGAVVYDIEEEHSYTFELLSGGVQIALSTRGFEIAAD